MSRVSIPSMAILAVLAVTLLFLFWREHRELIAVRGELAAVRIAQKQAEMAHRQPTATRRGAELAIPPPPASSAVNSSETRIVSEAERRARVQLIEYRRWMALAKNSDLIAALNLPGEKMEPFKSLLVERENVERDARDAAASAGVSPAKAAAEEKQKIDRRIRELIGERGYDKFVAEQGIELFRDDLRKSPILGTFIDAGVPLSKDQEDALAGVYAKVFLTHEAAIAAIDQPVDPVTRLRPFQQAILDQTSEFLPAAQLEALREFFHKDTELSVNVKAAAAARRGAP